MKSKTISLRLDLDDLSKLDMLFAKGMPSKTEQIRRLVKYYLALNQSEQLLILQKGYIDES